MDKLVAMFESVIKRSLLPSLNFFFVFGVVWSFFGYREFQIFHFLSALKQQSGITLVENGLTSEAIGILILFMIGLSTLLSILQQLLDSTLKGNYDSNFVWCGKDGIETLRDSVIKKLKEESAAFSSLGNEAKTDFALYQIFIFGRVIEMDTRRYVDQAKLYGIFTISLAISLLFFGFQTGGMVAVYSVSAVIIVLLCGRELVKGKYRSRARHIYMCYLFEAKKDMKKGEEAPLN